MCTVERARALMQKYYVLDETDYPEASVVIIDGTEYYCFSKTPLTKDGPFTDVYFLQKSNGVITKFSEDVQIEKLTQL